MRQSAIEPPLLPERPSPLDLGLSFPLSSLASIQRGYESQNQDEKWSMYFREPWVQIWRPSRRGLYCYAVRFEQTDGQRLQVVESWVGAPVLDPEWFGPDLECHRKIVTFVLENIAGASCETLKDLGEQFEYQLVSGRRRPKSVSFYGEATSLHDVEEIAERLRDEVAQMLKDGWQ